jgi:hypothetical protein
MNISPDGSGLPLPDHAADIASRLDLSEQQRATLCAELSNALLPALHWAERGDLRAVEGIERVLAIVSAIRKRGA